MKKSNQKIAILQPLIPHYRETFFKELNKKFNIDLFIYENDDDLKSNNFKNADLNYTQLKSFQFFGILIYNFFPLLHPKYKVLILPGEIRSLTTWILLFVGKLTSKKIILWGHGISARNYLEEENKLLSIRVIFHKFADHIWLYTEKEKAIWSKYIDANKITALNNTIDTKKILSLPKLNKEEMKIKYKISTKLNLIYCARFTTNRRIDLMLEVMKSVEDKDIGFIIIGEGENKPDFSKYEKVYDFGAVYDEDIKHELFTIADLYFQPAWTGLSIVEAMAYGKPIVTFERSDSILQCVEYSYIENEKNGFLAKNIDDMVLYLENMNRNMLSELQKSTKEYTKSNLGIEGMIYNATNSIKGLV
jgi:glycosyltransferase involved in cell wall biosynthesis